jgi:NAD dependent epimerase/dehydratase
MGNLRGKRVLVTGADGFIGSHLAERLVRDGAKVRAFVLYNSFGNRGWLDFAAPEILSEMEIVAGDVRDPLSVRNAVTGCEVVFHLAALIAIPYSYQAPESYVDTNVKGTLHVLQACRDLGVSRVVHTSTSEVYGTAERVPIDEGHRVKGQSPYSATKIAADHLAISYHCSFATPVSIARPFNTFGPRQSARAVIPTIITQIASGAREIRLGALSPTRDFCFVEDTVSGFLAIASSDRTVGEVVNIGSGFEISISDTAHSIREIMNGDARFVSDEKRLRPEESEVFRLFADTTKLKNLTDWKPAYEGLAGFKAGLKKTVDWFAADQWKRFYRPDQYQV